MDKRNPAKPRYHGIVRGYGSDGECCGLHKSLLRFISHMESCAFNHIDSEDVELVAIFPDGIRTVPSSVYQDGRSSWGWPDSVIPMRDAWLASLGPRHVGENNSTMPIVYHGQVMLPHTSLDNQCCGLYANLPDLIREIDDSNRLTHALPESVRIVAIFPGGINTVPRNVCSEVHGQHTLRRWREPEDIAARRDTWLASLAERL